MSTAAAPTGTVTAVMGDVVGSSGLWEREPESMAAAISQLGELTRELAGVHGGHLPVEQGEGDNLVAVFAEAGRAAAFALEVAAAVRTRGWPGGIELRLRLGMDTGDATHDPETGYQGGVFNRCSRLRNLVDETRILISSTTRGLIIDALPTGAAVDDRGHRHLRGHDRPEHVWELRGDDVPPASQPLPPDDHGGSIPLETSPLVGRDDEVARLQKAVADHRLVTLTGAGGAGKTRLAQHIGLAALEDQRDGVWWVDLSPVTDAHRVPTAIAEAVGLDEAAGSGAALRLVADLTQRHGLLILDNCEHLLDAVADVVEPVLVSCPDITVLVTSRELLDLDGEQAVRVRPLGLPDTDEIAAAALGDWPATALFVARASAVTPLAPTDEDASRIVQICRRLDGLPLAIELAATRARVLSLERILEGLDDRFGLLVGRRRASSRQRTLEASIAWSYELLPSAEQHALNRLSVFPGPFDLDGAIAVIGGDGSVGEHAATQLLSSLVDKSLVSVRDGQRARRYRLLDSIRHFAADRLHESDDEERARDAHLEHVLALGRDGLHGLHSTRLAALAGTADLREELEDVRAAEAHALERGRAEDVVALHLPWFSTHIVNSTYHEARRTLRRLVDEPDLGPVARTRAAAMLATYLAAGGRAGDAADRTSEVLADARGTDDALTVLLALVADSYAATWAGREGLDAAQEAWELAQQRAEDWGDGTVALAGLFAGIAIGHLGGGSAGLDILRSAASTAEHVRDNGLAATAATYAAAEAFRLPATVEECRRALEHALQLAPATLPRLRSLAHAVAGTFAPLLWGDVAMARRNVDIAGALAGPIGGGTHAIHAVAEAFTTTVEGDLDRALEQTTFVRNLFAMTSHRWWQMFCA
ncbi:MAG: NB-ARC domain-containing protein, partial [Nitriliruptorales bacterium]|nr:NB-ARC domain-containing protein [Nitriliruptorales bacterium]